MVVSTPSIVVLYTVQHWQQVVVNHNCWTLQSIQAGHATKHPCTTWHILPGILWCSIVHWCSALFLPPLSVRVLCRSRIDSRKTPSIRHMLFWHGERHSFLPHAPAASHAWKSPFWCTSRCAWQSCSQNDTSFYKWSFY